MTVNTYEVPVDNLPKLEKKLKAIQNKAAKLKAGGLTVKQSDVYMKTLPDKKVIEVVKITINGEMPRVRGYEFIATLDHLGTGENRVGILPGKVLPNHFRTAGPNCEHCGVKRVRRDTYVLRAQDGKYIQVGRTCMGDFLATSNPDGYMKMMELIRKLEDEVRESTRVGLVNRSFIHTVDFLAMVSDIAKKRGFYSLADTKKRNEQLERNGEKGRVSSTSEQAYRALFPGSPQIAREEPTEEGETFALDARGWMRSWGVDGKPLSDFMHNVKAVCALDVMEYRHIHTAAALIGMYIRFLKAKEEKEKEALAAPVQPKAEHRETEPKREPSNEWLGSEGDHLELKVCIRKTKEIDTYYGTRYVYTCEDENGNEIQWWASADIPEEQCNKWYMVAGTVKEHNEFRGRKRTVLTRVKQVKKEGAKA